MGRVGCWSYWVPRYPCCLVGARRWGQVGAIQAPQDKDLAQHRTPVHSLQRARHTYQHPSLSEAERKIHVRCAVFWRALSRCYQEGRRVGICSGPGHGGDFAQIPTLRNLESTRQQSVSGSHTLRNRASDMGTSAFPARATPTRRGSERFSTSRLTTHEPSTSMVGVSRLDSSPLLITSQTSSTSLGWGRLPGVFLAASAQSGG